MSLVREQFGELGRDRLDERDSATSECFPLVLCIGACLHEAQHHAPVAVQHLLIALWRMGSDTVYAGEKAQGVTHSRDALACYLEFLLPEVAVQSEAAASSIRHAIAALRVPAPSSEAIRYH